MSSPACDSDEGWERSLADESQHSCAFKVERLIVDYKRDLPLQKNMETNGVASLVKKWTV